MFSITNALQTSKFSLFFSQVATDMTKAKVLEKISGLTCHT